MKLCVDLPQHPLLFEEFPVQYQSTLTVDIHSVEKRFAQEINQAVLFLFSRAKMRRSLSNLCLILRGTEAMS